MKITYYCRHSTFDNEYWYCSLNKGKKHESIANYRLDMSPAVNARQSADMRLYGYLETYDLLPDDLKIEFMEAVKKLGGKPEDLEFIKPPF
jgi:hypothetical protein